jgi:hypothetical protein
MDVYKLKRFGLPILYCIFFFKMPIFLYELLAILSIYSDQLMLCDNNKPKWRWTGKHPWKIIWDQCFSLWKNNLCFWWIKLQKPHFFTIIREYVNCDLTYIPIPTYYLMIVVVSCHQQIICTLITCLQQHRSRISRKRRGPKTNPWGTSAKIFCYEDNISLNITFCDLWQRQLINHCRRSPDIP